jgi:phage-related protein
MDTIPSVYWMVIITVLVGFVCFVLYQLGVLLMESKNTVVEARKAISKLNPLLDDITDIVATAKDTVYEVNKSIIRPVKKISSILSVASGLVEGITKK